MVGRILMAISLLGVAAQNWSAHAEDLDTDLESARNKALME